METDDHEEALLRQLAEIGPGYRGKRRSCSAAERRELVDQLQNFSTVPAYATAEGDWIERRAKLFEAGDYPDKGITITAEHLESLASTFDLPVPVLIEHAESPLELGYLTAVEPKDGELFGTIALTREANMLVERSGARSLSLGLAPDLSSIREVSLVRNPRVASAQLYSSELRFHSKLEPHPKVKAVDWQRKYDQLVREKREEEAGRQVANFVRQGRLTPAQAPIARAMLISDDAIEFDGASQPLAQLLLAMIQRQPPHAMFGEKAPAPTADYSSHLLLPEEVAFYQQHFPGVSLDEIAKRRG